jgi:hypothetical protein
MAEEPYQWREGLKIQGALQHIHGNRWASFFGASNYQKMIRAYKSKYIQNRPDPKNPGKTILFDTLTGKVTNEADISKAMITRATGSETPYEDLKNITLKQKSQVVKNLGNMKDGVSFNDIAYNLKRHFSGKRSDVYDDEGNLLGKKIDLKRDQRAEVLDKAGGPSYGSDEYILANPKDYTSAMIRQARMNLGYIDRPNPSDTETTVDKGDPSSPVSSIKIQNQNQGNNQPGDKPIPIEGADNQAAIKPSIERWTGRGSGRTRKQATAQSLAWLDQQGFDTTFLKKARFNQADLMEDLRIRGPHYTNQAKSMLRIGSGPDSILLKKKPIITE